MQTLKRLFSNFYVVVGVLFVVWLTFFDSTDLYTQIKQTAKLRNLTQEKEFYLEKIEEVKADREELLSNDELLEKFARENYLMHKEGEDVFIVVEDEKD